MLIVLRYNGLWLAQLGLDWSSQATISHQQSMMQRHFSVRNSSMLRTILEGDPISFVNVRHPFERLVSAFLDQGPGHNVCYWCTFEQFVTYLVLERANASIDQTKLEAMNIHWRPYHTHCSFCNVS